MDFENIMLVLRKIFFINANVLKHYLTFLFSKRDFFKKLFPSLEYMKTEKALKLVKIIREFDLFEERLNTE